MAPGPTDGGRDPDPPKKGPRKPATPTVGTKVVQPPPVPLAPPSVPLVPSMPLAPVAGGAGIGSIGGLGGSVLGMASATASGVMGLAMDGAQLVIGGAVEVSHLALEGGKKATELVKYYPDNNGFMGAIEQISLMPGQIIDRYGGSNYSRFFSPSGTPASARALPSETAAQPLRNFEVLKPFEVQSGTVAPWFGQPGGGTQYLSPVRLEVLIKRGIVREIP
jgi:hypothetical protein